MYRRGENCTLISTVPEMPYVTAGNSRRLESLLEHGLPFSMNPKTGALWEEAGGVSVSEAEA